MKRIILLTSLILGSIITMAATGCQNTISALTATLGNASASIAGIEGNPTLAAQLRTDTAAAVSAINSWKYGSPASNAIFALGVVETDLSLICPSSGAGWQAQCSQYAPLIQLALGTAQTIIQLINPNAQLKTAKVNLGYYPKTAKDFTREWNNIANSSPGLAPVAIK